MIDFTAIMVTFFIDTNFFLQCQAPEHLPWPDLAGKQDILLLVPRAVQQEIDRLKQSGNSRRARRARNANSLLRKILVSPDIRITIRDSMPHVLMSLSPLTGPVSEKYPLLDYTQTDDQIISEILTYAAAHPEEDVRLLSHDTNPLATARQCGLPYKIIPDSWLLLPETDERDKEVEELKKTIEVLKKEYPEIAVRAESRDGSPIAVLEVRVTMFRDLTAEEIENLMNEVRERNPMVTRFEGYEDPLPAPQPFDFFRHYEPPTKDEIKHYIEVEYPGWLKSVRNFIVNLPRQLEGPGRHAVVVFMLENKGARPANNVTLEFTGLAGLLFAPPQNNERDDAKESAGHNIKLPAPPKPPRARNASLMATLELVRSSMTPASPWPIRNIDIGTINTNRHGFYWKDGKPIAYENTHEFTCEEFRHKVESERFELKLYISPEKTIKSAAISCRLTASNLPEPVLVTLPVRIAHSIVDTLIEARQIILKD